MGDRPALPPTIYIVGAQCTGKTTLVNALTEYFCKPKNRIWTEIIPEPSVIKEVARNVLKEHDFTAFDITSSPRRALELQKLILEAQFRAEEKEKATNGWYISDRSAIDPVVYARFFVGEDAAAEMVQTETWQRLAKNMLKGQVFVCEPNPGWLSDDGVRLMPTGWEEWMSLHGAFCRALEEQGICYEILRGKLSVAQRRAQVVKSMFSSYLQKMDDGVANEQL